MAVKEHKEYSSFVKIEQMDQHAYLLLSLCFITCLAAVLVTRKDLRKSGLALLLFAAPAGVISEYWYKQDYWQPPTILPDIFTGSGEDLLFAGSVMVLSIFIYPFLANKRLAQENFVRAAPFFITTFTLMGLLQLLSLQIGFPTILTAVLCCSVIGGVLLIKRPDLTKAGLYGALFMGVTASLVYTCIFGWFFPDFWDSHWLMKDGLLGIYVLPGVPITELLWYMSLGFFASIAYPFALNEKYTK